MYKKDKRKLIYLTVANLRRLSTEYGLNKRTRLTHYNGKDFIILKKLKKCYQKCKNLFKKSQNMHFRIPLNVLVLL